MFSYFECRGLCYDKSGVGGLCFSVFSYRPLVNKSSKLTLRGNNLLVKEYFSKFGLLPHCNSENIYGKLSLLKCFHKLFPSRYAGLAAMIDLDDLLGEIHFHVA